MSKPDLAKLKNRLEELRERYELLKSWQGMTKEEFWQDPKNNIDFEAVYKLFKERIEDFKRFETAILRFVEQLPGD